MQKMTSWNLRTACPPPKGLGHEDLSGIVFETLLGQQLMHRNRPTEGSQKCWCAAPSRAPDKAKDGPDGLEERSSDSDFQTEAGAF